MQTSGHFRRRSAERNISEECLVILNLYGSRLDKRDGLRLDKTAYNEIITICNNSIKNHTNKRKENCYA